MEDIRPFAGQELVWEPSSAASRAYELRDGEQVVATLAQPNFWKRDRVVTTLADRWSLTPTGFTGSTLVVADAFGVEVARITRASWGRGATLSFMSGDSYDFRAVGFWGRTWLWRDQSEQVVASLKPFGVWRWRCAVTVGPASVPAPILALLAAVGLSLIQVHAAQTASAVAATTASV